MMKKLTAAIVFAVLCAVLLRSMASALVTNGNFETGDFTGWTKSSFVNLGFNLPDGGPANDLSAIVGGPAVAPLSLADPNTNNVVKYPAYGHYSARVNSEESFYDTVIPLDNGKNANVITQTITASLSGDGLEHIKFAYAAVMGYPGVNNTAHTIDEKPYFRVRVVNVTNANDVIYDFSSYVGEPGKPWQDGPAFPNGISGDIWKFIDWKFIDLTSSPAHPVNAGDQLLIEVTAAGCSQGGHAGYVYVDEITDGGLAGPMIEATGPATRVPGQSITYTYTYTNGSASTINATIHAVEPVGVNFTSVSGGPGCSLVGDTVTCNDPSLAAGGSGTFTVDGIVTASIGDQIAHDDYDISASGFPTLSGPTVFTDIIPAGGTATPTQTVTVTSTPTVSRTPTITQTATTTVTTTRTPTVTPTLTGSMTMTATQTFTTTVTATRTPTVTATRTGSVTPTRTSTATVTATATLNQTFAVTINQTAGQVDPTNTRLLSFTVVFAEAVSNFTAADVHVVLSVPCAPNVTVTGSGATYTVSLTAMSKEECTATVTIPAGGVNSISRPAAVNLASTSTDNVQTFKCAVKAYTSIASTDGWVLESASGSNMGGSLNTTSTTMGVGDDASNREYRIFSRFDLSADPVPANANIAGVNYRIKQFGITGINPLTTHGNLLTFMNAPYYGSSASLELSDYQTVSDTGACIFDPTLLSDDGYRCLFFNVAIPLLPKNGVVDLRSHFSAGDTNNTADLLNVYTSNAPAQRPQLFVFYYFLP